MRLYYRQDVGRPMRVAWTLEEIGEPYQLVALSADEVTQPEHLARHPLGRVPVLEDGGLVLFESTGICLQLADRYPAAGLIPALGTGARALVYQWAIFAMTELERPTSDFLLNRRSDPDWSRDGVRRFQAPAQVLERVIADREFIAGDGLTVADIVTGGVLALARYGELLGDYAALGAYLDRLAARPAFQRAAAVTESIVRP